MRQALERLAATAAGRRYRCTVRSDLPASSGGVTAFKFRDPEGHPLELLAFPAPPAPWDSAQGAGPVPGHRSFRHQRRSTRARSKAFYASLGLRASARSLNSGTEQANLDGLPAPRVEVTALTAERGTPHVELLCYRRATTPDAAATRGDTATLGSNDIAATRLVFERDAPEPAGEPISLVDPDGHHVLIL